MIVQLYRTADRNKGGIIQASLVRACYR